MKIFELSIVVTLKGEGLERKVNIFVVLLCFIFIQESIQKHLRYVRLI